MIQRCHAPEDRVRIFLHFMTSSYLIELNPENHLCYQYDSQKSGYFGQQTTNPKDRQHKKKSTLVDVSVISVFGHCKLQFVIG